MADQEPYNRRKNRVSSDRDTSRLSRKTSSENRRSASSGRYASSRIQGSRGSSSSSDSSEQNVRISSRPAQTGRTLRTAAQLERIRNGEMTERADVLDTPSPKRADADQQFTRNLNRARKRRSLIADTSRQKQKQSLAARKEEDSDPSSHPRSRRTGQGSSSSADTGRSSHAKAFPLSLRKRISRSHLHGSEKDSRDRDVAHQSRYREQSAHEIGRERLNESVWTKPRHSRYDTKHASRSLNESYADSPRSNRSVSRLSSNRASKQAGAHALRPGKTLTRIFGVLVVLLVVFGGAGLIDNALNGDKIYEGVWVGDIDLSGKTIDEATSLVTDEYAKRVATNSATFYSSTDALESDHSSQEYESIQEQISYEESLEHRTQWTVSASILNATFDVDAVTQAAYEVGRSDGGIIARLQAFFQGHSIDPACSFDTNLFEELRSSLTESVGTMRVNYDVNMEDGIACVTEGHDGEEVTQEWLTKRLNDTFLGEDELRTYIIEIEDAPLQITEEQAQETADTINASLAKGAVFVYEDQTWNASRDDLAQWITTEINEVSEDSWSLGPVFDLPTAKSTLLSELHSSIDQDNLQVSFTVADDDSIEVTTNATGMVPLVSDVIEEMNNSFFVNDSRSEAPSFTVESTDVPSTLSFEDARDLGIVSEISTYTTQYSAEAEARRNNIHLAADYLNKSIAKANGGTWSFNDTAGESTEERGYQNAGAIVGGEYSDAIGGGICQVATTVFNSVYDSGFPITERHNHSLRIASYPEGRDAAIAYPTYDLVWENDSDSDVLLMMSYTNSSVTATLWGVDPGYQVSTEYGEWEEGGAYSTTYRTDESLASGTQYVETTGVNGSSITIVRTVKDRDGNVLHEDPFSSTYAPKNEVIVKSTS